MSETSSTSLAKSKNYLPATAAELRAFVIVGKEKIEAYRAKLRAVKKVGLAKAVRDQTIREGQTLAEQVLYAEARLGELLEDTVRAGNPQLLHGDNNYKLPDGVDKFQSHEAQLIARHVGLIPRALAEATEREDIVTRRDLLRLIHTELNEEKFDYKRDHKSNRNGDIYVPQGYDACQTPAYAIDPLLPYLSGHWIIWEPACGENFLVDAFYDASHKVVTGDILTGQNFFEYQPDEWDCQITNPPYSIKYDWLARSYELQKPFALLLPVETLGAKTAQALFAAHGLEVIFLDKRVNFKMPNKGWEGAGAQFPVAWFTWKFNLGAQMIFAHMDYPEPVIE